MTSTSTPVNFKAVIPKPLQTQKMLNVLMNGCQKIGKKMVKDFDKTTKTWQGEKPEFRANVVINPPNAPVAGTFPKNITVMVAPKDDGSRGAMKWFYLNYGTKVRRALMSADFSPKTKPGLLKSYKGKGKMIFVSKKLKLPGIKPRKWNIALMNAWDDQFKKEMLDLMYPVIEISGHSARMAPGGGLY